MLESKHNRERGFSMVEVLVSLIILMIGLLGLAGLMVQGQRSEMESYQRVQALTLLQDMVARINANRNAAGCYAFTPDTIPSPATSATFLGTSSTFTPACTLAGVTAQQQAQAVADMTAWNALLLGASEKSDGNNVGVMVGARGCINYDGSNLLTDSSGATITGSGIYTVSVVWQGLGDTFANTTLLCGRGNYGSEAKRRVVSMPIRIGSINNTN